MQIPFLKSDQDKAINMLIHVGRSIDTAAGFVEKGDFASAAKCHRSIGSTLDALQLMKNDKTRIDQFFDQVEDEQDRLRGLANLVRLHL